MGGGNESKLGVKICLNADTCDAAQDAEPVPRLGLDAPIQEGVKSRCVVGHGQAWEIFRGIFQRTGERRPKREYK